MLPRGCTAGPKADFVISAAAAIMEPKEADKKKKELNNFTSEFRACDNKDGKVMHPGRAWGNAGVFQQFDQGSKQGAAESALEPKQGAAIISGSPAIPLRSHPVLPTPKLSPQLNPPSTDTKIQPYS